MTSTMTRRAYQAGPLRMPSTACHHVGSDRPGGSAAALSPAIPPAKAVADKSQEMGWSGRLATSSPATNPTMTTARAIPKSDSGDMGMGRISGATSIADTVTTTVTPSQGRATDPTVVGSEYRLFTSWS